MGTDLIIQDLVYQRNEIIEKILNDLREWDNTIESGIQLIESNQVLLNNLEDVNSKLYQITDAPYQVEEYNLKLYSIIKELEKLTLEMKKKRNTLIEEKQQLSKKDQIFKNYVSIKKEPIFIDKDIE